MRRTPPSRPPKPRRDVPPPRTGPQEKEVLSGFLDYLRDSVAAKLDDAPEPEVRTPGVGSGTNLLGLVTHLTHVERHTFLGASVTDWRATFHADPDHGVEEVLAAYRSTVAEANEAIAACTDLGEPTRRAPRPQDHALDAVGAGPHDRGDRPPRRSRRHPARADRRQDRPMSAPAARANLTVA